MLVAYSWSMKQRTRKTLYETIKADVFSRDRSVGCWDWAGAIGKHGYGVLRVGGRLERAHRIAFQIVHGKPSAFVCHTCDNRRCFNPDHLWDGTNKQNLMDAAAKGRTASGARHWTQKNPSAVQFGDRASQAKLTAEQVLAIRAIGKAATQREIAQRFGVNPSCISRILAGKRRPRG